MTTQQTTSAPCQLHLYHSPKTHSQDRHHVQPLSWGGSNAASNIVVACCNGHRSVHLLLDHWYVTDGQPEWDFIKHFGPAERELARLGYERWSAQA